jgi:hypothetical protein
MTLEKLVLDHPWQEAGYEPHYRFITIISLPPKSLAEKNTDAYNNLMREAHLAAKSFGVSLGSCDVCGTGIMNHFVCRDSNKKYFVVGCDCIEKQDQTELITAAKKAEKARIKKAKQDRQIELMNERVAARLLKDEQERQVNGGLTDWELSEKNRKDAEYAKRKAFANANAFVRDLLSPNEPNGSFIYSMRSQLEYTLLKDMSPRCQQILVGIYAKSVSGKSKGKDFESALDAGYELMENQTLA